VVVSGVIVVTVVVMVMMFITAVMIIMVIIIVTMIVIFGIIIVVMMAVNMVMTIIIVMLIPLNVPVNANDCASPRNPALHSRFNANVNSRYSRVVQPFQKINAGAAIKQLQESGRHHIPRRAHAAFKV